jgi:hypothetical protein
MSAMRYRSSRPNNWIIPRPHRDAHQRFRTYGPVRPMHEPNWFERLLGFA